jgi:hypothetical protein
MPPSPELVERSADLKRMLVEFGESRRFARQLDEAIQRAVDEAGNADQETVINAIDHFLFQHRLRDGPWSRSSSSSTRSCLRRTEQHCSGGATSSKGSSRSSVAMATPSSRQTSSTI